MCAKSDTYTLQPITYVYVVEEEEVPGRCRLACDSPAAAAAAAAAPAVPEKQVRAV